MPPPIPLQAGATSCRLPQTFLIPSFAAHAITARHNSTSAIPPESPRYIDIPTPPQEKAVHQPFVKGVLPKPRSIFSPRGPNKTTEAYLRAVAPEPSPRTLSPSSTPVSELSAWKARQAASRRENLRSSLLELAARKSREDHYNATRSAIRTAETKALRDAPETDAERFTKATLLSSQDTTGTGTFSAAYREDYRSRRLSKYTKHLARAKERRRDNLHTLYMNAGDFITTEERMREEVDKAFDDKSQFNTEKAAGLNIWNLGVPETVSQKYASRQNAEQKAVLRERMKRMAEALTGGKIKEQRTRICIYQSKNCT